MKYRKAPNLWTLKTLQNQQEIFGCSVHIDGQWLPARPLGLDTLSNRFKLAWQVFVGKCDAVKWPGNQ